MVTGSTFMGEVRCWKRSVYWLRRDAVLGQVVVGVVTGDGGGLGD